MKTCKKGLHQYEDGLETCPECKRIRMRDYNADPKRQKINRENHKVWVSNLTPDEREERLKYMRESQSVKRISLALQVQHLQEENERLKAEIEMYRHLNVNRRLRHTAANAKLLP